MADLFENKDMVKVEPQEDKLLAMVLEKGNIDVLKEFLSLRATEEARQAEKLFDENFAKMQAELPAIVKDKSTKAYSYATLENVLEQCAPVISKHGFSYSWKNETVKDGQTRVWCVISGYGHKRESYFDIPIMESSQWTNAIQQMGSATSYGKRYSLCNALGIIIKEEDDDAHSFDLDSVMATASPIAKIREAKTLDELAKLWTPIYNEYKDHADLVQLLIDAKDKRKKELSK